MKLLLVNAQLQGISSKKVLYSRSETVSLFFSDVNINSNDFKVKTGEPDMLNPSCFENISQILFNIAERAGINSSERVSGFFWNVMEESITLWKNLFSV